MPRSHNRETLQRVLEAEGIGGLRRRHSVDYGELPPRTGRVFAYPCPCNQDGCSSWMVEGHGISQGARCSDEVTARVLEVAPKLLGLALNLLDSRDGDDMKAVRDETRNILRKAGLL